MTSPANHGRDTLIAALQADATATSYIPAARQYPHKLPAAPVKPFSRLGHVEGAPERLSGWSGENLDGAVHLFVAASDAIPDPESWAHDAAAAFAAVIEALPFAFHDRTVVLQDTREADEYHAVVYYQLTAVADFGRKKGPPVRPTPVRIQERMPLPDASRSIPYLRTPRRSIVLRARFLRPSMRL